MELPSTLADFREIVTGSRQRLRSFPYTECSAIFWERNNTSKTVYIALQT